MKKLLFLFILSISLFSCKKEKEGLSYYQFVEEVNNKPVKDTVYYFDTKANKEYKFTAQSKIAGEGFIIWGDTPSNSSENYIPFTLEYIHAKKKKDRILRISSSTVSYENPIILEGKITFDGGEIRKK